MNELKFIKAYYKKTILNIEQISYDLVQKSFFASI